jgi:glucuronate isomerase
MLIHPDRLFPAESSTRRIARALYQQVRNLSIISPHGHTQASWFAANRPFPDPAQLFVQLDHYVLRMLYSQGVPFETFDVGKTEPRDPREIWRIFANHYHLFRGTPTRIWLDLAFHEFFGLEERLSKQNSDQYYDMISAKLGTPEFLPRALYQRFHLEVLATTDSPLDSLESHALIQQSDWKARILPTFRPDCVLDPDFSGFAENVIKLGILTGEDTAAWRGYLNALRVSRARFRELGCTATDHGHPSARTADLSPSDAARLFDCVVQGIADASQKELFRAQMLTEMARMSLDDGLVLQIHAGSVRNHNRALYGRYGSDIGADIPTAMHYVDALRPLLDRFGNESALTIIVFTLDESTYSRELAPLAGHYPCLRLGPPWWFHDGPEGMRRFRERITETAGFYNTVGFNDDARSFFSIPGRHDTARRMDCSFLARLVAERRLAEDEAVEVAWELAYGLAKRAYRL